MSHAQPLLGQVAFVTGGSRGIGRAIAVELARAGADVAINYWGPTEEAASVVEEITALGRRALALVGDVADYQTVVDLIAHTVVELGPLTILVTNAVYSDREPFVTADLKGFHRTIDVTMWGAFHALRAGAAQLIAQGTPGSIVLISSPHAYIPVPNAMAYNMAKAAIDQMARTAALELIDHRIRVNVIHPGWIDTPGERKFIDEASLQAAGAKLPWGRMGRPEEIARGVVFFCDPAAEYMTGSQLLIDGGNTLPWWARGGMAVPN